MSISAMAASGIGRQYELTTAEAELAAGHPRPKESAMEKVTKFIPSEVLGLYVSGLGIFAPLDIVGKWGIYVICLILIVPIMLIANFQQRRKQKIQANPNKKITTLLILFAVVAFTAWAAALPGTPFLSLTPLAVKIGGFAVLVLAVTMYPLADAMGMLPKR